MNLDVKVNIDKFKKDLDDILEVAAVKAWETAVARTPAAGQTPYANGQLRQSLRVQKTGPLEYTIFCPVSYGAYVEFGTGPKGRATGKMEGFPNDPYPLIDYHNGEVLVTRWKGELLDPPVIRHTQGMEAQPFLRPALLEGVEWLKKLLSKSK